MRSRPIAEDLFGPGHRSRSRRNGSFHTSAQVATSPPAREQPPPQVATSPPAREQPPPQVATSPSAREQPPRPRSRPRRRLANSLRPRSRPSRGHPNGRPEGDRFSFASRAPGQHGPRRMRTERLAADAASIARAAEILRRGGLVAFPTETVYGLGARATTTRAARGIFEAKGRPPGNPLIVHVPDVASARALADDWPPDAGAARARHVARAPHPDRRAPSPTASPTWSPPAGRRSRSASPSTRSRAPCSTRVGLPIAAPSANRSTEISPTTAEHVEEEPRRAHRRDPRRRADRRRHRVHHRRRHALAARVLRPGHVTAEAIAALVPLAPLQTTAGLITAPADARPVPGDPRAPLRPPRAGRAGPRAGRPRRARSRRAGRVARRRRRARQPHRDRAARRAPPRRSRRLRRGALRRIAPARGRRLRRDRHRHRPRGIPRGTPVRDRLTRASAAP